MRVAQRMQARWTALAPVDRAALGVLVAHLLVRAWLLLPGNYFQDDFVFLQDARREGLSADYLFHTPNGHLIPVSFLLSWAVGQAPGSFLPAALVLLALQTLASVALWLLLRRAVGPRPALLVGLAAALFTPLMFTTVTWWAAALVMLGVHLSMGIAGYCHLRLHEGGRVAWLAGSVAGLLLGFAFWEKAVVVPVFLFLLTVLVSSGGARSTLRGLLRLWYAWLAYGLVTIGYLVVYLRAASVGGGQARSVDAVATLARHQLVDVFARGMVGGPWHSVFPGSATWLPATLFTGAVVAQLVLVVGVLAWRATGPRSLVAWGTLLVFLLTDVALTAVGRGLVSDLIDLDPRYVCDAIPMAAVCLAVMFTPTGRRAPRYPGWVLERTRLVAVVAAVLLFNSSLVTASASADALRHKAVTRYLDNVRLSMLHEPNLVLVDSSVPEALMIGLFPPEQRLISKVLPAYDLHPRVDLPSESMKMLDTTGVARPIFLSFARTGDIDATDDCGVSVEPGRARYVYLDKLVPEGDWVMKLSYYAGSDAVLDVTMAGAPRPVGVRSGAHSVFVPVPGGTSSVKFEASRTAGAVCLTAVTVGSPLPSGSS